MLSLAEVFFWSPFVATLFTTVCRGSERTFLGAFSIFIVLLMPFSFDPIEGGFVILKPEHEIFELTPDRVFGLAYPD